MTTASVDSSLDDSHNGTAPWLIAAAIFCAYLFLASHSTIWDRDEARFSRATYEMVNDGNYLYATFNGKLRPDKPILIYWLMSVPVRLFGQSEWAYRLVAVLATVFACFFTYLIGKELLTRRAGLWAMAILSVSPLMLFCGAAATSDAVLLMFITASFLIFVRILKRGWGKFHWLLLALVFSGGMLTKGPVALIPGLCFIAAGFWINGRGAWRSALAILGAAVASVGVFAIWFFPANAATHGELWDKMVVHHVGERILSPLEHHGGHSLADFVFYFIVIATAFFPWTLLLPSALAALIGKPRTEFEPENVDADRYPETSSPQLARRFLWSWIGVFLVIMIAVTTKLPHYILPIWPALALSIGGLFDYAPSRREGLWNALGALLYMCGIGGAVAGALYFFPQMAVKDNNWGEFVAGNKQGFVIFGALAALVGSPLAVFNSRLHFTKLAAILAESALAIVIAGYTVLPAFESLKVSDKIANSIRKTVDDKTPVALCGYVEASLIFYLRRPEVLDISTEKVLADWSAEPGQAVLVIPKRLLEKFQAKTPLPAWRPFDEIKGFNYSNGKWVELLLIQRH